jgi:hypothetical protein
MEYFLYIIDLDSYPNSNNTQFSTKDIVFSIIIAIYETSLLVIMNCSSFR